MDNEALKNTFMSQLITIETLSLIHLLGWILNSNSWIQFRFHRGGTYDEKLVQVDNYANF
jgi:hypothetical protein